MSLYSKILGEFNKIRLLDKSKFTEFEINKAMDQLCKLNTNFSQFDRDVAQQLWEHTTKTPQGKILLKDYIQTILDARNILKENIDKCSKQLTFQQDAVQKDELEECLLSYGDDYRILGEPFMLEQLPSRNVSMSRSQMERSSNKSQLVSQIFTENTTSRQESTTLKIVLVLTLVLVPFQFLCMFAKNHFLNILCYFSVISIFALQYFDKIYIKFCEIIIAVSIVFDILWAIVHSSDYWNTSSQTQYSHLQPGFLKFIYILTILMIICKILIMIILFRFTKNTQNTSKFVRFLNQKIYLSGKSQDNPVSNIVNGKNKQ